MAVFYKSQYYSINNNGIFFIFQLFLLPSRRRKPRRPRQPRLPLYHQLFTFLVTLLQMCPVTILQILPRLVPLLQIRTRQAQQTPLASPRLVNKLAHLLHILKPQCAVTIWKLDKSGTVGIRNPTIWKPDPFENRTFWRSDFEWKKWQNGCHFVKSIRKPNHSKTGLRSTIQNPGTSGFRIPTVFKWSKCARLSNGPDFEWWSEKWNWNV